LLRPSHIYVHIPFCKRKCYYCDFASIEYENSITSAYLSALEEEVTLRCSGISPETIYIGGGTPSILHLKELELLLRILSKIDQSNLDEFSIEINPGTIDVEKMMLIRKFNVNRVSIGIQSFHDKALTLLGRIHNSKLAKAAVAVTKEAGIDNISLDLINSWPGQTPDMWLSDLQAAVKLRPKHVSSYALTYEDDTPLNRKRAAGKVKPLGQDSERELFDLTSNFLEKEGFLHYELSSFCMEGYESRHNTAYWLGRQYIGLGASACSFVDDIRFTNCRDPQDYINRMIDTGVARHWQESLTPEQRARERAVINLRLAEGINLERFQSETGFSFNEILGNNDKLIDDGWLEFNNGFVRLSKKAYPLADAVLMDLI
jgi:oxygen-independent coproporphyrinogen-3 oxidase